LVGLIGLLGAAAIGWNGVAMALVGEIADRGRAAEAAALGLAASNLGLILFPPAFGLVVDLTGSYALAYQLVAGAMLVNAALVVRFQRRHAAR